VSVVDEWGHRDLVMCQSLNHQTAKSPNSTAVYYTSATILQEGAMADRKVGRNDPCPCGSGRKYKQCHERKTETVSRIGWLAIGGIMLAAAAVFALSLIRGDAGGGARQVWDPVHGHYHTIP
jgi:hypothetical protein